MPVNDIGGPTGSSAEGVFAMDPESTLRALARELLDGQQVIAQLTRSAATVRERAHLEDLEDLAAKRLLTEFDDTCHRWLTEALPALAASMQLALEVYDTFGPGLTTIDDATEAAIWNNKWFSAEHELSGRPRGGRP
jgi:hypothetical protein